MERQIQNKQLVKHARIYLLALTCMFGPIFSCAEDGKGKRSSTSSSDGTPSTIPTTIDEKQRCFEQKRQTEIDAGRSPDNVAIYEECGFFKGEFGWREQYVACKNSGKVWDGEAKTCSSIPMDSGPCTYDTINQKWLAKYENLTELITPIKDAGYEVDQCGTTPDNHPYLVFIKANVKTLENGGIEEEILYKYIRH